MEIIGATPFEDITDYRASDDGSHVLIKGWIGTREDHLAIKEEDALFVIRGLAYGIDLCELARGEEPKLLRLMPVERRGSPSIGKMAPLYCDWDLLAVAPWISSYRKVPLKN